MNSYLPTMNSYFPSLLVLGCVLELDILPILPVIIMVNSLEAVAEKLKLLTGKLNLSTNNS